MRKFTFPLLALLVNSSVLLPAQSAPGESGQAFVQMLDNVDSNQSQKGPFRAVVAKQFSLGSNTIPAGANAVVTLESIDAAGARFWSLKLQAVVLGGQTLAVTSDSPAVTSGRVTSIVGGLLKQRNITIPPPLSAAGARVYLTAGAGVRFNARLSTPSQDAPTVSTPIGSTPSSTASQPAAADAKPNTPQMAQPAQLSGNVLTLQYSTFLAVPGYPAAHVGNVALDNDGNVIIGGSCGIAPFVAKLDRSGSFYHWFKVLAKDPRACKLENFTGIDGPLGAVLAVAADSLGNAYATGYVYKSSLFPTVNAFRPAPAPGLQDQAYQQEAFAVKLSPAGQVEYSTLIGGSDLDYGAGVVSDKHGGAWVVGSTRSNDFPRVGALADCPDSFVAHFDERGKPLLASCLGTHSGQQPYAVNTTSDGDLYLTANAPGANTSATKTSTNILLRLSRKTGKVDFRVWLDATPIASLVARNISNIRAYSGNLAVAADDSVAVVLQTSPLKLVRYSPEGQKILEKPLLEKVPARLKPGDPYPGTIHYALGYSTALASDGGLYATGYIDYPRLLPGQPYEAMARLVPVPANMSAPQGILMKLDPSGNPVWYMVLPPSADCQQTTVSAVGDHVILSGVSPPTDFPTTPGAVKRTGDPPPQYGDDWLMEFTEEPPNTPCSIRTSPSALNLSNQGAQKQVLYVLPNRGGCQWSVSSGVPWAHIAPASPGPGYGYVKIDFDTNLESQRSGSIKIESSDAKPVAVPVTQGPVACQYTMTPPIVEIASRRGGSVEVKVSTSPECDWSVKVNQPWISLQHAHAKGNGAFVVAASPNPAKETRSGLLEIGTTEMTVVQHADDVPPAPIPDKIPRKAN